MKKTFLENEKNALLRKFHTLLREGGITNEEKLAMLSGYGVESSKDMNAYELLELCNTLHKRIHSSSADADRWRKRLISSIGAYLRAMTGDGDNIAEIKAIACRAAQVDNFNSIPTDRLKSLYNAFNHRAKDLKNVDFATVGIINRLSTLN